MPATTGHADATATGDYKRSDHQHSFHYDSGVIAVPTAGREPGVRLIRLHGGFGERIYRWQVDREGKPPVIPSMTDTSGDTFLGGFAAPMTPTPSAVNQKTYDWSVSGEYRFVQNVPRVVGEAALPVGQHPFVAGGPSAYGSLIAPNLGAYYANAVAQNLPEGPFHTVAETLPSFVPVDNVGNFSWPFLAMPTAFASSHLIKD